MSVELLKKYTFEKRLSDSTNIIRKYPNRVPIICERNTRSKLHDIDKNKFLANRELTLSQFSYIIRKRLKLKPEMTLFLLINDTFLNNCKEIGFIYDEFKSNDGYLYITYYEEVTFG
jgi:GABA(A) receptor-associated protein